MASRLEINQASVTDDDLARQIEFSVEIEDDERDFVVKYAVLTVLSGDEPENDAREFLERFSNEIADMCADAADRQSSADIVTIDETDLE